MMKTDEDRNVIGVLGGCLGFSESDDNASEVLGVGQSLGAWLEWCQNLKRWSERSWRSSRGSILDWMESQQSDRDLNNLTTDQPLSDPSHALD